MASRAAIPISLSKFGESVRVHAVRTDEGQTRRLRELGLLEGQVIRVLSSGDPLICQIGDCRFGVGRLLARSILVEPMDGGHLARSA